MPHIAYGEISNKIGSANFGKYNFDYNYPKNLKLKPGTPLHDRIVDKVMKRAYDSAIHMSNRFASWNEIDRTLTCYIDLSESERALKYKDDKKPVSIVFPHSYAILETILGYLIAALFQEPIFRYEGVGPDDIIGAILMEKIIDVQANRNKFLLNLHTQFRDCLGYGFGIVAVNWGIQEGFRVVEREEKKWFGPPTKYKEIEEAILFEGNELINIDPYLSLPDPNVPITEMQRGEYFGWIEPTNYMDLLTLENAMDDVFNVKYLQALANKRSSIYPGDRNRRNEKLKMSRIHRNDYTKPADIVNLYAKIIPKEWEVGDEDYPRTYLISVASDSVIIRLKPLGLTHNRMPIAIAAPDYDGYSINPVSRLEILYGMQHTLDWMFNTHVANVRKAINDTIIYDPYLLNSNDLKNPKPGGLVRMRKAAWGRGVKDSFQQLAITDITRGHVADAELIKDAMDKIGGVDAAAMGALRSGGPERLTSKEFSGTRANMFTRLERVARIISVQSMQDIGYMSAHHSQQFMSQDQYVKIGGMWQDVLMKEFHIDDPNYRMPVTPFDILVDYDLKVRDGTVPGGNYSKVWVEMFEILANHQELLEKFDLTKIFLHIARNEGAKNVESFIRVKQVEEVDQEVQAGNLAPLEEVMGQAA